MMLARPQNSVDIHVRVRSIAKTLQEKDQQPLGIAKVSSGDAINRVPFFQGMSLLTTAMSGTARIPDLRSVSDRVHSK
jgi:hypothetical protein